MKRRKSKLDEFEADLQAWFGSEKVTLTEAQARLADRGCRVSTGRLSAWWEARQRDRMRSALLERIASGARLAQDLDAQFKANPAPELETLIKLLKVLVMQSAVDGGANPELLSLVPSLMRPVMEQVKAQQKAEELGLARDRFRRETCELFLRWNEDQRAREIATSSGSNADKIARLEALMFGDSSLGG